MSLLDFEDETTYSRLFVCALTSSLLPYPPSLDLAAEALACHSYWIPQGGRPGISCKTLISTNRHCSTQVEIKLVNIKSAHCLGAKRNSGRMCIAKGCTIWLHKLNVFRKTEDFGFSFTSESNQYFMLSTEPAWSSPLWLSHTS